MSPRRRSKSKSSTPAASPQESAETATTEPSTPETEPSPEPPKKRRKRRYRTDTHTPQQKVEAILALWTERRKPSAICRDLDITWAQLNLWQDRALEAMLQALQPRRAVTEEAPLTKPLAKLFERKGLKQKPAVDPKLQERLRQVQAKEE